MNRGMIRKTILLVLLAAAPAAPVLGAEPASRVDAISRPRAVTAKPGATVCTPHPADATMRQRIVDVAAGAWQRFRFPVLDLSRADLRRLPAGGEFAILPPSKNPRRGRITPRLMRMGTFEDSRRIDEAIGSYWAVIPIGRQAVPPVIERQNAIWQAYHGAGWAQPWSAAFISWVMCEAGLTDAQFLKSPVHWAYIDQAIRKASSKRGSPGDTALFTALDPTAATPRPGDLICADRYPGNRYATVADRRAFMGTNRPTHCDVVVKVDRRRLRLHAIGGNVVNSVTLKVLGLRRVRARAGAAGGKTRLVLQTPDPAGGAVPGAPAWFALLRLGAPGTASLAKSPLELAE